MKHAKFLLIAAALAVFTGAPALAQDAPAAAPAAAKAPALKKPTTYVGAPTATPAVLAQVRKNNAREAFASIMQAMPKQIGSYITETRKLELVPGRDEINRCIAAIESGDSTLAGEDQQIVAAFRSVKYPLSVSVSFFKDFRAEKIVRGSKVEQRTITLAADVSLLDAAKGVVKEAMPVKVKRVFTASTGVDWKTEGGSKTDEAFVTTAEELCKKIAFTIVDKLAPAQIVGMDKKGVFSINKGKGTDIAKGQIYVIYEKGDEMFDPETGESLGFDETEIGKAKVTSCQPKASKLKVIESDPDYEIAIGNIVRPAEETDGGEE